MSSNPIYVLAVLGLLVTISEWLVRTTFLKHLGSALLVIVLTAVVANVGVIPTYGEDLPLYHGIFSYVAPFGIFLLLLQVNLREILRAGLPMVFLFLAGSAGTVVGVLVGMQAVDGAESFGGLHHALGGMFAGTYTGGSVNFIAVANEYEVATHNPILYAGATAVDSAMTTVWMGACVLLPRLLSPIWPKSSAECSKELTAGAHSSHDREVVDPMDVALIMGLGLLGVWASEVASAWLSTRLSVDIPSALVLTTLALAVAQIPSVQRLRGLKVLGMFSIYLFLAVIGALCDFDAVQEIGDLAITLSWFVCIVVAVHGVVVFALAAIFRQSPVVAAVASQANIGGGTSALALARSLDRGDLAVPAMLVGSCGTAIGNYVGFFTAAWLG